MKKIFEVSTEGDCEGRSTQVLGIFQGDVLDIINYLSDKVYYNFFFKEIEIQEVSHLEEATNPEMNMAHVFVSSKDNIIIGDRSNLVVEKEENRVLKNGSYSKDFYVSMKQTEKNIEEIKQAAMAKLTEEEKKALFGV